MMSFVPCCHTTERGTFVPNISVASRRLPLCKQELIPHDAQHVILYVVAADTTDL